MAVAEVLQAHVIPYVIARCGIAICGWTRCAHIDTPTVYGGMLPVMSRSDVTVALTRLPGGQADPRQIYAEAYDNPAFTLHVLGEDLIKMDDTAESIREGCDRTAHITTEYGTINTLSVGPPRRIVRSDRPRYDVQMTIEAEFIRPGPTPGPEEDPEDEDEEEPADTQPEEA